MSIRKYRHVTDQGDVSYATSTALIAALRGNATYRGAMWDEFEGGSGAMARTRADQVVLFVQDSVVATTFHQILMEPTFAVA